MGSQPLTIAHVPTPLATSRSTIATVIRHLTGCHAQTGGRSIVVSAKNRDLRVEGADNMLVDFSSVCPRAWFNKKETAVDFAAGLVGKSRPHYGHIQDPAVEALSKARPDVIVVHEGQYALASIPAWRHAFPDTPVVAYVHNPVSRSFLAPELRRLTGQLDGIVFVSAFSRDTYSRRLRCSLPPTSVVHNGVAAEVFNREGREPRAAGPFRITFAGQTRPFKAPHLMLEAVAGADLQEKPIVRVIGSSDYSPNAPLSEYEKSMRAYAQVHSMNVEFVPFCTQLELARYLRESDVVCVPSTGEEAFGMAVIEAMACGAAVVASNRGGLPEACGSAGIMVDPQDRAAFSEALMTLEDRETLSRWQCRSAERAAAATWDETYRVFSDFMERLVRARPRN